jgi:hypothetical protein
MYRDHKWLIINFSETILPNGGDRHSDEFNQHMSSVIDKRESIINEIHILNKNLQSESKEKILIKNSIKITDIWYLCCPHKLKNHKPKKMEE